MERKRLERHKSCGVNRGRWYLWLLLNLFKNFYTWFHSHLLSLTASSAGLISSPCQRAYTFSSSLPSIASPTTISPTSPSLPPLSVFLYVYPSTFTVTALESQEFKLAPSPSLAADPCFTLPLHLSPSQRLKFISLCASGVWKVPRIPPQGSQLCPFLVTHSQPAS